MLVAPSGWLASAAAPARDLSQTIVQVGETTAGDAVKDSESDDDQGNSSAMTMAVNGRIVAATGDHASIATSKWNWTLLLLGCAGLVVAQIARHRPRRGVISYR